MFIKTILKGVVVGVANVIPGLSGGTMAVLLGIYPRLLSIIDAFSSFNKPLLIKESRFIAFLGLGGLLGIGLFSHVLDYFIQHYAEPTSYFFMGLVLASIPAIFRAQGKRFSVSSYSFLIFTLLFAIGLAFTVVDLQQSSMPESPVNQATVMMLFMSSLVASSAMIIPGISGSLLLLLFGTYSSIISAIKHFDLQVLAVVAVAVLLGIVLTSKIMKALLDKFPTLTLYALVGLILGTLPGLYVSFSLPFLLVNTIAFFASVAMVHYASKL